MTIDQIKEMSAWVGSHLDPGGDWAPVLILSGEGENIIEMDSRFMENDSSKDACAEELKRLVSESDATKAYWITTAWGAKLTEGEQELFKGGMVFRASESRRRVEILSILEVDRHRSVLHVGTIERSPDKPPVVSTWETFGEEINVKGKFAEAITEGFGQQGGKHEETS